MHLLVTGFEPFKDSAWNPSAEIATRLRDKDWAPARVSTIVLPVVTERAADLLLETFDRAKPDVVVMLGEAAGRRRVQVEEVAVNRRRFSLPDNDGRLVEDDVVVAGGPRAHFASLPTRSLVEHLRALELPVELSGSAGTFLCNEVSYRMLHHLETTGSTVRAGFVHVPRMPEQVASGEPCLPIGRSCEVVRSAIRHLASATPHSDRVQTM